MDINLFMIDFDRLNGVSFDDFLKDENFKDWYDFEVDEVKCVIWGIEKNRSYTEWQSEIKKLVDAENSLKSVLFEDLGSIYNVILGINYFDFLFGVAFGHAHSTLSKICVLDFGMEIASREINPQSVTSENINKYFSTVLSQTTQFGSGAQITPQFFESYEGISGKPESKIFGKRITCRDSIKFEANDLMSVIEEVIPMIPKILYKEEKYGLPRVEKIKKADDVTRELHQFLLKKVKKDQVIFNILDLFYWRGALRFSADIQCIYVEGKKNDTEVSIQDSENDIDFLCRKFMKDNEIELDKIIFEIKSEDSNIPGKLSDIVRVDLFYNEAQYMLVDGYWCRFNQRFIEYVFEEVEKMEFEINKYLYSGIPQLKKSELPELEKNNWLEDRIVEYYCQQNSYNKLHRTLIKPIYGDDYIGSGNELADIAFIKDDDLYLVSTKVGFKTNDVLKCIDQSLYSLEIMRNPEGFGVDDVADYLHPKYVVLHFVLRKNLKKSNNNDPFVNKINKNEFKLSNLGSDFVRTKLIEWKNRVLEAKKVPKIFFDIIEIDD